MAVKLLTGFEAASVYELATYGGSAPTFDSSVVRSGGYSLSCTMASGNYYTLRPNDLSLSTAYIRYYTRVHVTTNPTVTAVCLGMITNTSAPADIVFVYVVINTSGVPFLRLMNKVTSTQVGSDYQINPDEWYLVELKIVVSATVGEAEMKVNGTVRATGSGLNTGTGNVARVIPSGYLLSGNGTATIWYDDVLVDDAAYPGSGSCITRQGKSGTPTYDTWGKSSGQAINVVWSETPPSFNDDAQSSTANEAQTMLTASFSSTQTGHGSEVISAGDTINACKVFATVQANPTSSAQSLRRRVNSSDTDTLVVISLLSTTVGVEEAPWTDTLDNLNSSEMGGVKGNDTVLFSIGDIWMMVDFTASAEATPVNVNISESMV